MDKIVFLIEQLYKQKDEKVYSQKFKNQDALCFYVKNADSTIYITFKDELQFHFTYYTGAKSQDVWQQWGNEPVITHSVKNWLDAKELLDNLVKDYELGVKINESLYYDEKELYLDAKTYFKSFLQNEKIDNDLIISHTGLTTTGAKHLREYNLILNKKSDPEFWAKINLGENFEQFHGIKKRSFMSMEEVPIFFETKIPSPIPYLKGATSRALRLVIPGYELENYPYVKEGIVLEKPMHNVPESDIYETLNEFETKAHEPLKNFVSKYAIYWKLDKDLPIHEVKTKKLKI